MTASGTCGYGLELEDYMDLSRLGGIVVKGLSPLPRSGNPPERIVETPSGMLNAIGLQNIGVRAFVEERLPVLRTKRTAIVANIFGESLEDYRTVMGNGTGGLSGPAIRPLAVYLVSQVARAVSVPIVGIGGITCGRDALEFLIAGAAAVQVGTVSFHTPSAPIRILEEMEAWCAAHGVADIRELIGSLQMPHDEAH